MNEPDQTADRTTRCGVIAVLGAPNAGKSTLVNRMVGGKVSIVSPKVQTTRTRVTGIASKDDTQLIFLDTPGIFVPRKRLDRAMVEAAWRSAGDADLVVLMVDAARGIDEETAHIVAGLASRRVATVLVLNKVDSVKPPQLLELTAKLNAEMKFAATFMISALTGDGVEDLRRFIVERMPVGPWLYPDDEMTDMSERLLAAEVTREQLFLQLQQELPYSVAVETEKWEDFADGSARVDQVIYVQRDNQKKIVIGENGARIKSIGKAARGELARIIGRPVHLFLHCKVAENWAEKRDYYRLWGLEYDA